MDENIYLGTWTNWSRGPIFGPTLTITRVQGNLLIAFTASFIAFVAARFWRILCFVLHRSFSTASHRHTLHHQRQVILRNSSAPESGLLSLVRLLVAWRGLPMKHLTVLASLALLSFSCLAGFTVAGGFSSSISTSVGNEVLLNGANCGLPSVTYAIPGVEGVAAQTQFASEQLSQAFNYAQQCYSTGKLGSMQCNKFVVDHLPIGSANENASCPFQDSICRTPGSNLQLDTGYIDSNDLLGLNAPQDERFAWRYVLQCAPLQTKGYTSEVVEKDNRSYVRYHYGEFPRDSQPAGNPITQDYIYQVEDIKSQYNKVGGPLLSGTNLKLGSNSANTINRVAAGYGAGFVPIAELFNPDGDLLVAFLSGNGILFSQPTDDGWYIATSQTGTKLYYTSVNGSINAYRPDEAALPLGCVERWQWCNSAYPKDRGCGPLASRNDAFFGAVPLFNLTKEEPNSTSMAANAFIWASFVLDRYPINVPSIVGYFGAKSLESQSRLNSGIQWPLPNNQWHADVKLWFTAVLAMVQTSFVEAVLSRSSPEFGRYSHPPDNAQEQKICDSQKIRSTAHTSFSLFGLCFTFILGGIIIFTSYALEPTMALLYKWRRYKPYAQLEWISNTNLQLHRLAHEELGLVEWSRCTTEVPTTHPDALLANLDISNPERPVLSREATDKPEKPGTADTSYDGCRSNDGATQSISWGTGLVRNC
ncbi:hypothetical protein F5Y04DRAFT_149312 [Hypomontagnella monticulosa]|nr:hypothetical protein F5Y04DRAFT_149312 [Hypomontagnella monticulosa]